MFIEKKSIYFVGDTYKDQFQCEQMCKEKGIRYGLADIYGYSSFRPVVVGVSFGKCNKIKYLYLKFIISREDFKGRLFEMGI